MKALVKRSLLYIHIFAFVIFFWSFKTNGADGPDSVRSFQSIFTCGQVTTLGPNGLHLSLADRKPLAHAQRFKIFADTLKEPPNSQFANILKVFESIVPDPGNSPNEKSENFVERLISFLYQVQINKSYLASGTALADGGSNFNAPDSLRQAWRLVLLDFDNWIDSKVSEKQIEGLLRGGFSEFSNSHQKSTMLSHYIRNSKTAKEAIEKLVRLSLKTEFPSLNPPSPSNSPQNIEVWQALRMKFPNENSLFHSILTFQAILNSGKNKSSDSPQSLPSGKIEEYFASGIQSQFASHALIKKSALLLLDYILRANPTSKANTIDPGLSSYLAQILIETFIASPLGLTRDLDFQLAVFQKYWKQVGTNPLALPPDPARTILFGVFAKLAELNSIVTSEWSPQGGGRTFNSPVIGTFSNEPQFLTEVRRGPDGKITSYNLHLYQLGSANDADPEIPSGGHSGQSEDSTALEYPVNYKRHPVH